MLGHHFAPEPPGLSLLLPPSSRDQWWLRGKSSYQWSTASAKGRKAHSHLGLRTQLIARSVTTFLRWPVVQVVGNYYERHFHPVTPVPAPDYNIIWRLTKKSPGKVTWRKLHLRAESMHLVSSQSSFLQTSVMCVPSHICNLTLQTPLPPPDS